MCVYVAVCLCVYVATVYVSYVTQNSEPHIMFPHLSVVHVILVDT